MDEKEVSSIRKEMATKVLNMRKDLEELVLLIEKLEDEIKREEYGV